jgi:hypothetical protein
VSAWEPTPVKEEPGGLHTVNGWLAVVAAATAILFLRPVYDWLLQSSYFLLVAAVLAGVPALAYVTHRVWERGSAWGAWLAAACVVTAFWLSLAVLDARALNHHNCWAVPGRTDVWACAPGSEPEQYAPGYDEWTDTESPGRYCDQLSESSTGATVWRCVEE